MVPIKMPENTKQRLLSIDILRAVVMILMALDHARDFFTISGQDVRSVSEPALFLTRWITHFCAPVFVFLAGVSAFLYGAKGRTKAELRHFLITRGFWLILVEFTIVRLGWTFSFDLSFFLVQVIFALGISMLCLALMIYLPKPVFVMTTLAMIFCHNLLDGTQADQFGQLAILWHFLHEPKLMEFSNGVRLFILYPAIPWIGIMAAGYLTGPLFLEERKKRVTTLVGIGVALTLGFVIVRYLGFYGDPNPWIRHDTWLSDALSFVNTEKYPPSFLYISMTLGPALIILALLDKAHGRLAVALATIGLVPFFYYIAHIFLIHGLAVLFAKSQGFDTQWLFDSFPPKKPEGYGVSLITLYGLWALIVVALYPLCKWYAHIKTTRKGWWWSYL